MSHIFLLDKNGNIIYEGNANSKIDFIKELIKEKKSFENIVFSGINFSYLDLSDCNFNNCIFENCEAKGIICNNTSFKDAEFTGFDAAGSIFKNTSFKGAKIKSYIDKNNKIKKSSFIGTKIKFCILNDTQIEECDWLSSEINSSSFSNSKIKKNNFSSTKIENTNFIGSELKLNNFENTIFDSTIKAPHIHLPITDKTRNATIIGNKYKKTEIGDGYKEFSTDRTFNKYTKITGFTLATVSVFALGTLLPFEEKITIIQDILGKSANSIVLISAISLLKEKISDQIREYSSEKIINAFTTARNFIYNMSEKGEALKNMFVAFVTTNKAKYIWNSINLLKNEEKNKGFIKNLGNFVDGKLNIMICDKKNIFNLISHISRKIESQNHIGNNLLIIKPKGNNDSSLPESFLFNKDGTTTAFWNIENNIYYTTWDKDKNLINSNLKTDFLKVNKLLNKILRNFTTNILKTFNMEDLQYDERTHNIQIGINNSIITTEIKTGLIDNPKGPAIINSNGDRYYYKKGKNITEQILKKEKNIKTKSIEKNYENNENTETGIKISI